MEFRTVEYFLAIVEDGSLSAAAQRLGMSQPALTKVVRRLEEEAGATLFDRSARGVSLTVYGRALLRHAKRLRARLAEARDEIETLKAGFTGEVRLGAGPAWQTNILPEAISRLRRTNAKVRVDVAGGLDNALKAQLREGAFDFVLAATPEVSTDEPDLEWKALISDDYRVIASVTHPLRRRSGLELSDLLAFPWILHGPGTTLMRKLAMLFRAQGLALPEPVIQTDVVPLKLALMRRGDYLSYHGAGDLAEADPGWIKPLEVEGATWRRAAGVIVRRGIEANPAAEALIRSIEEVTKGSVARSLRSMSRIRGEEWSTEGAGL